MTLVYYLRAMLVRFLLISLLASIGTLLTPTRVNSHLPPQRVEKTDSVVAQLPNLDLETTAQAITIQVRVGEDRGSGILIARDNNVYTVITNAHVVERGDPYSIETGDGVQHIATLISKNSSDSDLALLQFRSSNSYQVANIGTNLTEGETVFAAGFPFDADNLKITGGTISLLPDKPLKGGYQIGLTNETVQGMSGGALLNSQGKVIGVLGKGRAILDTAYTYSDGTTPTLEELNIFKQASFSIPIAKVAEIAPHLDGIFPQPSTQTPPSLSAIPTRRYTGIVAKVDSIAQQITVRIDNLTNKSNGSGVIIARQGNSYYVATAKHVLCTSLDTPKCEANGQHQIITPDGATHQLDYQTVEAPGTWLDVAVFRFESPNHYSVATLGKYDVGGKVVFVSGFPGGDSASQTPPSRLLTGGWVRKAQEKEFTTKDAYSLKSNGEGLVYTNISYGGMSGGAVLDPLGRLVGIYTGAENEVKFDDQGNYEQISLGYSLGVAIPDFLGLVQQMQLHPQWLQVETSPTSEITDADIAAIAEQLLTTTKPIDAGVAAWMNYGNQLWRYGRHGEAVQAFEKVIELEPDFDQAYYAMGLAFWSQKDFEPAIAAFKQATKINPNLYYYWRYLGSSYLKLEQYAEAEAAYSQAIHKNPEDFVLYVERGDVLLRESELQGAIESYTQAIRINSKHPWAYNNRGVAYANLGQYEQAIANYSQAIAINPQDDYAYNNRGAAYADLGQYEQAIADYSQAIAINPQDDYAYNNRGVAYKGLNQYESAIANFEQAIAINPQFALAYYNRGVAYKGLKQYQRAIANYTQAITINPQLALAYNNRGVAYTDLKLYEQAIADYTQAIAIKPQFAEAYYNRGIAYTDLELYEQAIANYTQAIVIEPQFAEAYHSRGVVYSILGNLQQARQNLQQAANLFEQKNNLQSYQTVQQALQNLSQIEAQ